MPDHAGDQRLAGQTKPGPRISRTGAAQGPYSFPAVQSCCSPNLGGRSSLPGSVSMSSRSSFCEWWAWRDHSTWRGLNRWTDGAGSLFLAGRLVTVALIEQGPRFRSCLTADGDREPSQITVAAFTCPQRIGNGHVTSACWEPPTLRSWRRCLCCSRTASVGNLDRTPRAQR